MEEGGLRKEINFWLCRTLNERIEDEKVWPNEPIGSMHPSI